MIVVRLMVCVPALNSWVPEFGGSLWALGCYVHQHPRVDDDLVIENVGLASIRGSNIVLNRMRLARMAIDAGATHLLWIDADMVFPETTAHRLLRHRLPVVACNCIKKSKEYHPVAFSTPTMEPGSEVSPFGAGGEVKTGLEKVGAVGFGVMLTAAEVFSRIAYPWFGHAWVKEGNGVRGIFEDGWFCARLNDAEIGLYVDNDLSLEVGHYGGCIYRHGGWDVCEAER